MTTDPLDDVKAVVLVAGLCLAGFLAYRLVKAAPAAAAAAADAVNPASQTNLVNRGVSAAGAAITGDQSWTLGGWLYDLTHSDPNAAANAQLADQNAARADLAGQAMDYGTGAGWDSANQGLPDVGNLDAGSNLVNPISLY